MGTSTSITSLTNIPRDARNRRLVRDTPGILSTALQRVSDEEVNALTINPTLVAYYKRLLNGRRCTCKDSSLEDAYNKEELETAISIDEFLVRIPTLSSAKASCPICFETGYVGGYERVGCKTVVLDYTSKPTISKIQVNKLRPYWYQALSRTGTITWTTRIPKYYTKIVDLIIAWKEEPRSWLLQVDNQDFSESYIRSKKGNNVAFSIKMKDKSNENAGIYAIFIVFAVASSYLVNADFPNLNKTVTADFNINNDIVSPIQINLDRTVTTLNTTDVMIDSRFNRVWRVLEIINNEPIAGVILHRETQSRVVREFEHIYQIPNSIIKDVYPSLEKYSYIV